MNADDLDLWLSRQRFLDAVRACRGATEREVAAYFLRYDIVSRDVEGDVPIEVLQ
jgi:hypothetical protein